MTKPGRRKQIVRAYFVDEPLGDAEVADVQGLMDFGIEQVRVPFVLPHLSAPASREEVAQLDAAIERSLRKAEILRDSGTQVVLVAMRANHLSVRFTDAVFRLTGLMPFLVQTVEQRVAIGNPGELRVMDLHRGMSG